MSTRISWSFALALMLAGCQHASSTVASRGAGSNPTGASSDIVANVANVVLGSGWYPFETYAGQSFRWVDNDAVLVIPNPSSTVTKLAMVLEAGPGMGVNTKAFTLDVIGDGNIVARPVVHGRERIRLDLPVLIGKDNAFRLHVQGGGQRTPNDKRVLNFRVFSITDASNDQSLAAGPVDIVRGPNLKLGPNWYPLEQYKGDTFRWVDNDAAIQVDSDRRQNRRLQLLLAAGPSVKTPGNVQITLTGFRGRALQTATVKERGTVYLNLPLNRGRNDFALHTNTTGKRAPGDPRVLNFRVFSISVQ